MRGPRRRSLTSIEEPRKDWTEIDADPPFSHCITEYEFREHLFHDLLTAGAKGKRYALPNAEVMIHQPLGGAQGQATEIEIAAKRILFLREKLNGILAERTGQPLEVIAKDTDRDNFMTAERAKEYGLIDHIITRNPLIDKK